MSAAIEGLKPELVWKYFAEIARIPRCSKNEAAASQYVLQTAQRMGLQAKADPFGNVWKTGGVLSLHIGPILGICVFSPAFISIKL